MPEFKRGILDGPSGDKLFESLRNGTLVTFQVDSPALPGSTVDSTELTKRQFVEAKLRSLIDVPARVTGIDLWRGGPSTDRCRWAVRAMLASPDRPGAVEITVALYNDQHPQESEHLVMFW